MNRRAILNNRPMPTQDPLLLAWQILSLGHQNDYVPSPEKLQSLHKIP